MRAPARIFVFLLFLFGIHFSAGTAWGEKKDIGLSVEPGWLLIRNVPVGQLYDMEHQTKTLFKIHNGSDKPRRYRLKADRPDKVGVKVLRGYASIPDPAWFWFEKNEVLVQANGTEEINMFVRIPDEEKYCNQKWALGIDVEGKPEAGEGLVLAVSPVFYIETESRAELKEKPAGFLGLAPATIVLEKTALGKNKTTSTIKVYNNDSRPHFYKIGSIIPHAEPGRQVIPPSSGFSWIHKKEWLKPSVSALKIGPHEQKSITLHMDIPEKTDLLNQRWEGIVFVESEEGPADFARVQVKSSE
ncbi:MAG: hypothetical protein A2283_04405 [Lentisphaerae bacterium RIFOXYA12_FULL_48_11]|nr:MAG: hypothetical protein A2283_04405 [Lentisphaerae bacterium RIFOXYA12_FULL_48_11]